MGSARIHVTVTTIVYFYVDNNSTLLFVIHCVYLPLYSENCFVITLIQIDM